ncbi:MAG: D-alanyl-D-alanine carboxypeptidase/D-alanyl-D-alanine-endopeptidase [Alcanivorax sp.]|nr:D-alanyl-D-alanine carboxypeptidase/D-alanyl-D-alanine-endopeptidase [Alcanivorax sp.]
MPKIAANRLLAILLLAALPFTAATAETPSPRLQAALNKAEKVKLSDQALAVSAIPLDGPGKARSINGDTPISPGSIMKLVTTYAALELLGPNYQWHTRLYTDGKVEGSTLNGNLYFVGSGDPKLTEERLWLLMRELHNFGIDTINGEIRLDGSVFHLPNGIKDFHDDGDNPHAPFLVEPNSLLTNLNVIRFRARADGRGIKTWMEPKLAGVTLDNQLVFKTFGHCPSRYQFDYRPSYDKQGNVTVTVTGILPRGCRTDSYLSLLKQDRYTTQLLASLWKQVGGSFTDKADLQHVHHADLPADATLLATTSSRDLVTMVRDINKWSNNVMARQLFLTLGAHNRQPGDKDDVAAARREVRQWLSQKGIDVDGLVFENGSGLSRSARLTTSQLAQLLDQAWHSPYGAELIASLPLVAMDGTMRRRLRGSDLVGQGHIKTGSLRGVRAVAGFTRDENNTTWAVVAVVNDSRAWRAETVLDSVLEQVHLAARPAEITTASQQP